MLLPLNIDLGSRHPFREIGMGHTRGVEGVAELTLCVDDDDATSSFGARLECSNGLLRRFGRADARGQRFDRAVCHHDAGDPFTPTRR